MLNLYTCRYLDESARVLELGCPDFDFDSFFDVAAPLLILLGLRVIEQECNADLHVWLVDFDGCRLMLKGEHYSGQMWLEGVGADAEETLVYLAQLLRTVSL
ncbi:DUF3630 family protein [Photobacterium nomapromontoriensis]|uniref:DUF3630 family protein n=1 Tax=Photobacterium nomapromontoriensis TaxID=2910237 RepID=UPI003D0F647F